jgi:hypothetical protein
MLSVSNAGMARASSLTSLSMDVQVNMLQGAVIASLDDRVKIKEVAQLIRDYHSGMLTSESSPRARSNSTILPSKEIRDLRRREEEKKTNVFDHSPYKEMASKNKKLEMLLGKSLSCSTELALIAKKIREVTGSPMRFLDFSAQQQQKIIEESSYIGGAKELLADMDTLDAHVLATLIKAEGKEYDSGDMARRKCMFNHVRSPENPIYPWNSHRFDLEIFEVTNPIQYTEEIRNLIADRWGEFLAKTKDIESFLNEEAGLPSIDVNDGILNILQGLSEADRKAILKDVLHISWSTERFVEDEMNPRTSNPLGAEFRQHTTGAKSNVVRVSDEEDRNVNKWVFEAIVHGKPVTSGPSGHTLRYLNHYAMCSEMHNLSSAASKDFPSLEDARLVMLANLMAPKDHHSYHEIMLASIGVYDGVDVLEYKNKESYDDISATEIGADALRFAKEGLTKM